FLRAASVARGVNVCNRLLDRRCVAQAAGWRASGAPPMALPYDLQRHAGCDSADVVRFFDKGLGVPHAALHGQELPVIDVNGAADLRQGIDDGMDYIAA